MKLVEMAYARFRAEYGIFIADTAMVLFVLWACVSLHDKLQWTTNSLTRDPFQSGKIVSIIYGCFLYLFIHSIQMNKSWKKILLSFGILSLWSIFVVRPIFAREFRRFPKPKVSVEGFYITTNSSQCRQCVFQARNKIAFPYTTVYAPVVTYEEIARQYDIGHFTGIWNSTRNFSNILAIQKALKSASAEYDWAVLLEDDALFIKPSYMILGYLDTVSDYDIVFLDTRCVYANTFLAGRMIEATVALAFNTKRLDDFIRITGIDTKEMKSLPRALMPNVFAQMCNQGMFRCICAPYVKEMLID